MAQVTPNMQLVVWNNPTDLYDSSQLAKNFIAIDEHDHSGNGKGKPIDGSYIQSGSITNVQIANNTITEGNIASGGVNTDEIATNAVTTTKINDLNVTTSKIANNAITPDKIDTTSQQQMGLDTITAKRKRYKYIASTQTSTSGSTPQVLDTADRISNLVVAGPASGFGIIHFAYMAMWRRTVNTGAYGALAELHIINASNVSRQVLVPLVKDTGDTNAAPSSFYPVRATILASTDTHSALPLWRPLVTSNFWRSLDSDDDTTSGALADSVGLDTIGEGDENKYDPASTATVFTDSSYGTTGGPVLMPEPIGILVPTGTYTLEMRFAGRSGAACVVRNRHMWAWTESFITET